MVYYNILLYYRKIKTRLFAAFEQYLARVTILHPIPATSIHRFGIDLKL